MDIVVNANSGIKRAGDQRLYLTVPELTGDNHPPVSWPYTIHQRFVEQQQLRVSLPRIGSLAFDEQSLVGNYDIWRGQPFTFLVRILQPDRI